MKKTRLTDAVSQVVHNNHPKREAPKKAFRAVSGGAGVSTPSLKEIPAKTKLTED